MLRRIPARLTGRRPHVADDVVRPSPKAAPTARGHVIGSLHVAGRRPAAISRISRADSSGLSALAIRWLNI